MVGNWGSSKVKWFRRFLRWARMRRTEKSESPLTTLIMSPFKASLTTFLLNINTHKLPPLIITNDKDTTSFQVQYNHVQPYSHSYFLLIPMAIVEFNTRRDSSYVSILNFMFSQERMIVKLKRDLMDLDLAQTMYSALTIYTNGFGFRSLILCFWTRK